MPRVRSLFREGADVCQYCNKSIAGLSRASFYRRHAKGRCQPGSLASVIADSGLLPGQDVGGVGSDDCPGAGGSFAGGIDDSGGEGGGDDDRGDVGGDGIYDSDRSFDDIEEGMDWEDGSVSQGPAWSDGIVGGLAGVEVHDGSTRDGSEGGGEEADEGAAQVTPS